MHQVDSLGAPLAKRVEELPYLRLQTMDDEWHRPGLRRRYFKGHYLTELSDDAIDAFLSRGEADPSVDPARLPSARSGLWRRDRREVRRRQRIQPPQQHGGVRASTAWTDPAEDDQRITAARRYGAALEPFASGVYVNVLGDEGEAGVRRGTRPASWPGSPR